MLPTSKAPRRPARSPPSVPGTPWILSPHQRILFPPTSTVKPPRILHSSAHAELDPLILDLVALALRAYVTPWYNGGISRDPDRAFLQAVTATLVHVIQALEVRLATVNWVQLLAYEVPELVAAHYRDWDLASERAGSGSAHNLTPEQLFHQIQPHLAVSLQAASDDSLSNSSVPLVDKVYLRTLVDHLLRLLLPPEDYRAETERTILREILVGVVFGALYNRVAQPWFLHGIIARQLEAMQAGRSVSEPAAGAPATQVKASIPAGPLEKWMALVATAPSRVWTAITAVSNFVWSDTPHPAGDWAATPMHTAWLNLASAVLPTSAFLQAVFALVWLPCALLATRIDHFLTHSIARFTTTSTVRAMLEGAIRSMFPCDGWPAPKEEDPDEMAQAALKRRCEETLARVLPDTLPTLLVPTLPPDEPNPRLVLAQHLLRPLSSHVANVHLLVLLVDLVVGRIFPELVVGPEE